MNVFELYAKLGLDTKEYTNNLNSAKSKMSTFGAGMKSVLGTGGKVAAAGMAAVTASATALSAALGKNIKETTEYGDQVDKMSQRVGLSAEAYQKWDYVLNIAGTEMSNMRIGLKTMTNQLEKAKNGGKDAQENFKKLGVSMEELKTLTREQAFEKVIKGFQGMEDSTSRAALANKIFGRSGQELTPLFNQSAESTDKLLKNTEKYGMVMSDKAVKASADFKDSLTTLQGTITGLKNKMTAEFLPSAKLVTDGLAKMFAGDYKQGSKDFEDGITGIVEKAKVIFPKVATIGKKIISTIGNSILQNIGDLAIFGTDIITGLISGIINALPGLINALPTITQKIGDALITAAPALFDSIKLLFQTVFDMLMNSGDSVTRVMELIGSVFDNAIALIPQLLPKVLAVLMSLADLVTQNAPALINTLINIASSVIIKVLESLPTLIKMLINYIPIMLSNIATALKTTAPTLINALIDVFNTLIDELPGLIDTLLDSLPALLENVAVIITDLLPVVMDAATKLVIALVKRAPDLMAIAIKLPKKILDAIILTIIKVFPRLVEMGKQFISKTIKGVKAMLPELLDALGKGFEKMLEIFKIDKVIEIGKDIVKGIWKGIQSMAKWISDKVGGFADGMVGKMKSVLGIHSPSRVFAEIGRFMAEGLGKGWTGAYAGVKKIIENGLTYTATATSTGGSSPAESLKSYIEELNNANYERLLRALESTTIEIDSKVLGRAVRSYV